MLGLHGTQQTMFCIRRRLERTTSPHIRFQFAKHFLRFLNRGAGDLVGSIAHRYGLSVSQALKKLEELLRMYPTAAYTSSFAQKVPFNEVYDKKRISPHTENQNAGEGLKIGEINKLRKNLMQT